MGITGFGKSVYRVVWERPLALSGTSYKWLSQRGVHPSSGAHHSFQKEGRISYWLQLVCLRTSLLPYGFQSNLVSLESYFQVESSAVCYEGRRSLLMENVGNYRNCATRIIVEVLEYIRSGLLLSGCPPFHPGCSPSVLHRFG